MFDGYFPYYEDRSFEQELWVYFATEGMFQPEDFSAASETKDIIVVEVRTKRAWISTPVKGSNYNDWRQFSDEEVKQLLPMCFPYGE